jgi:hypothetical protein
MTEAEHGMRRNRPGMRAATMGTAFAAVAAIAATGFALVGCAPASPGARTTAAASGARTTADAATAQVSRTGQTAGPRSAGSVTPAGWAPVPYQSAQLSVPGLWLVESPGEQWCGGPAHGMIFAGLKPGLPTGAGCHLAANLAWIVPAGHISPGTTHRKPTAIINGIPVYQLPGGPHAVLYLVPRLGVRVGARGPLARRVLGTLSLSPLSVVLGRGPAGQVPDGWVWHRFGGMTFAAPGSWHLQHADRWATCGTGLIPRSLLLIDATRPSIPLPCPFPIPTAAAEQAQPGLTVVTGKYAAKSIGQKFVHCQIRRGVRICLSAVTGQGGSSSAVLMAAVSAPRSHQATYFLLGLPGPGAAARAVFGSIRLAGH